MRPYDWQLKVLDLTGTCVKVWMMTMVLSQRNAQTKRKRTLLLTGKMGAAGTSSPLQVMHSQGSLTI